MSALFNSIFTNEVTLNTFLISTLASLICGIITAIAATYRSHPTKSFFITLILLPMIVNTVIIMVNGNIGTGVAVMGAFSLVRFRSVPGKAKDIVSIFLAMAAGLSCATGYIGIAIVFTVIISIVMILSSMIPLKSDALLDLKITIPESLSFTNEFDDIFNEYTNSAKLIKVKTTNMGSLYKLSYKIEIKDKNKIKEMMDKLRCRNGNLEILITESVEGNEDL